MNRKQVAIAEYRFDVWTTDSGLPHNFIGAILQSRDGYLWLGSPTIGSATIVNEQFNLAFSSLPGATFTIVGSDKYSD